MISNSQLRTLKRLSCTESTSVEIVFGKVPDLLLSEIEQLQLEEKNWSIDHELLYVPSREIPRSLLSTKLFFCAISQLIRGPPALYVGDSRSTFKIYETEKGFHFCSDPSPGISVSMKKTWSQRPFQYSAALNFEAALSIVNILIARVLTRAECRFHQEEEDDVMHGDALLENHTLTFYDPCCGSGTNLFIAARYLSVDIVVIKRKK